MNVTNEKFSRKTTANVALLIQLQCQKENQIISRNIIGGDIDK